MNKKSIVLVGLIILMGCSVLMFNPNMNNEPVVDDNQISENQEEQNLNVEINSNGDVMIVGDEEVDISTVPYNFTREKRNEFIWNYEDVIVKRGKGYDVNEYISFIKTNWSKIEDGLTADEEQLIDDIQNAICHLIGFESDPEIHEAGELMYSYLMTLVGMQSRDLDDYGRRINNFLESR